MGASVTNLSKVYHMLWTINLALAGWDVEVLLFLALPFSAPLPSATLPHRPRRPWAPSFSTLPLVLAWTGII